MALRKHGFEVFWFFVAVTVLLCGPTHAQTFTGTISGRILDSQLNGIPNAKVILRSHSQGFERQTVTSLHGEYNFQLLPPGRFTVAAERSGFAVVNIEVDVVVATPTRADLVLRVHPLQQSVEVFGESGIAVQTESAGLGRTINPSQLSELPSINRSPYDFMAIMAGAALSNDQLGVGFVIDGGRSQSANYLLDGGENNDAFMSAPALDVPLDSIEEFGVQTNHFSAEYGRNSGFIANIVTKSGGNKIHGSLYDYVRNSALAANTFDNNAHRLVRPNFNRNQFGFTLGGSIYPKKVFFFVSGEPILVRSSGANLYFVPTPELLAISSPGVRSIFQRYPLPANLSPTDVLSRKVCPFGIDCSLGTGYVNVPAFALATRIGPQDAGAGVPQDTVLATGRVDWIANAKTQLFIRYAVDSKDEFPAVVQPYSKSLDVPFFSRDQNVTANLIHTWTANVVTESRLVYSRVFGDPDRFGGSNPVVPNPPSPSFSIQNEPNVTLPSGAEGSGGPANIYQFFQTVTWHRERHTIRVGGQFVQLRDNRTYGIAETADAKFSSVQDFVDGNLNFYRLALDPKQHFPGESVEPPFGPPSFSRHFRYNEPALFAEDSWKVVPRLTVTAGLRWEYFGVLHSPGAEHALDSNFYLAASGNCLQGIANGRFLRTIDVTGSLRGHFYAPHFKSFAPRLGAAYDISGDGKTVLRAGIGMFNDRRVGFELFRADLNPPSFSLTRLVNVPVTTTLLEDQYSAFPNSPISLDQSDTKPIDTHLRPAYTISWNATLEHEFMGTMVFAASYLGSSGSRLYSVNNQSRVGSGGLLNSECVATRLASDGLTALGPDYTNCEGLNPSVSSLAMRGNAGHSSFEALQLRLDSKRIRRVGIQLGANYSWSHSIDNSSISGASGSVSDSGSGFLDAFHPTVDRGSSDFDQRHRISLYWIWEIPFGGKSSFGLKRWSLGGWEVSGIATFQTGQPFTIGDFGVPDLTSERTRPRLTGAMPSVSRLIPDADSPNQFLYVPINQVYDPSSGICMANTTPFACEISVNGPFDNTLSRNSFRQPGTYYQNAAIIKNARIGKEGMHLQLRAEFFNVFNHSNLYVNAGTPDVSALTFTAKPGTQTPGVTVSFKDNRQIVLAVRLLF